MTSGWTQGIIKLWLVASARSRADMLKNNWHAGIVKEMGVVGLFTTGLPLRIAMVGTLTGLQWYALVFALPITALLSLSRGKALPDIKPTNLILQGYLRCFQGVCWPADDGWGGPAGEEDKGLVAACQCLDNRLLSI